MNILVLASHPDDETLGCGASIARWTAEGHSVYVGILAEGAMSRERATAQDLLALTKQTVQALTILGVPHGGVQAARHPDNRLDQVALLDLARDIAGWLKWWKPNVIYTHSGYDLNQDHVAVHRATLIAARPQPGSTVQAVYCYEVPSSTEWAFGQWGQFRPNHYIDVSRTFDKKVEALRCYQSELREYPHPRSLIMVAAAARRWGSYVGVEMAEAFELVWRRE